jgi:hypothetical protein
VIVASITDDEFRQLVSSIDHEAIHLETRDAYGTAIELPHMAQWVAGEHDDLEWLQRWCYTVRKHVDAGRSLRRARIVSEPLSDYQRWSHSIAQPMVNASVAIPGNDFYLLDNRLVIFLHYAGSGLAVDKTVSTDSADVQLCRSAFEAVWRLSIPYCEYQPVIE